MFDIWPNQDIRRPVIPEGDTIAKALASAIAMRGEAIAVRQKAFGLWRSTTWSALGTIVCEIGMGLVALGLKPGEVASILANTRQEWTFADYAIISAGGVSNGIYPTDAPAQCEYLITDSASRFVFVEDEEQLDKILEVRGRTPTLEKIIVIETEGLTRFSDPQVMTLDELRALGRQAHAADPAIWPARIACRKPDDLAILVYTSGTTGKPKGAMITNRNILAGVSVIATESLRQNEDDQRMAFLPLCHVAERVGGQFLALYSGAVLNFVENPETVPENVREISPTVFLAVPRIWEKFYSAVMIRLKEATSLQRLAYGWAIEQGRQAADLFMEGKPAPLSLRFKVWLGRVIALNNVRKAIGIHNCRFLATGAAPISPDLIRWYFALGVPMLEIWGMTETSGAGTIVPITKVKPGTIGRPTSNIEMKISADGEILARGPTIIAGYLNQPEKTSEAIRDGWLHTGDVGQVDNEGIFKITDRMKDIIITAGGKNVTPSEIENELKFSPYITDAVVIGDKLPYLTALIMIDLENVEKFAQDNDIPFSNYASLCRAREVQDLIQTEVDRVNAKFARVEQLKAFRLIEQQLTAEDEELTPTMKLKRNLVSRKYADLIGQMYGKVAA
ncbi:long-chain fatty acid--CoA ligase [Phreatobacter aquaticus]|uniref:Long-chain fatty acid--CoA ligase n=1 Tax=Phreatobacter aquaticus TaxID=2570229 RepID=A0A4D7QBU9_9HYPH|nr:long-chain fatty acid--CoA ligase [Phreatobacter aquaticus]QCK85500.1 long-chain fatty acid--CoA ligase [Phreatobacter aquaticus]